VEILHVRRQQVWSQAEERVAHRVQVAVHAVEHRAADADQVAEQRQRVDLEAARRVARPMRGDDRRHAVILSPDGDSRAGVRLYSGEEGPR